MMIIDTEFFNASHNKTRSTFLETSKFKDNVFLVEYIVINSWKELLERNNSKKIKSISIKRNYSDQNFDFDKNLNKLINEFLNDAYKNKVRTIVVSGGYNDIKILKEWLVIKYPLFVNKELLFSKKISQSEVEINFVDVYDILKLFRFSNYGADGQEFDKKFPKTVLIEMTSLKKLFNWIQNDKYSFKKEYEDIYSLCIKICELFTFDNKNKISIDEFKLDSDFLKKSLDHCFNDVLAIVYFFIFIFSLIG